jgi:hypothetical protein
MAYVFKDAAFWLNRWSDLLGFCFRLGVLAPPQEQTLRRTSASVFRRNKNEACL